MPLARLHRTTIRYVFCEHTAHCVTYLSTCGRSIPNDHDALFLDPRMDHATNADGVDSTEPSKRPEGLLQHAENHH